MNLRFVLVLGLVALGQGCAVPASDGRVHELVPDRESFAAVAQMLEHHCGSLDCHGDTHRNLRVYGNESLRFAESDRPLTPPCTTADEVEQDFQSAVTLEPSLMTTVVGDGGADPERLTLVRKALGKEHHKGGAPLASGSDADTCLRTWLMSRTDTSACTRAFPASTCF
jgi:hypothetical protein